MILQVGPLHSHEFPKRFPTFPFADEVLNLPKATLLDKEMDGMTHADGLLVVLLMLQPLPSKLPSDNSFLLTDFLDQDS